MLNITVTIAAEDKIHIVNFVSTSSSHQHKVSIHKSSPCYIFNVSLYCSTNNFSRRQKNQASLGDDPHSKTKSPERQKWWVCVLMGVSLKNASKHLICVLFCVSLSPGNKAKTSFKSLSLVLYGIFRYFGSNNRYKYTIKIRGTAHYIKKEM